MDGAVDFIFTVKEVMSKCARRLSGQGSEYDGGFSEYLLVPSYRFLIRVDQQSTFLKPEELAPLTDAGLTPYRAIKKVRHILGPNRNVAIIGIGGLGFYAIQYARILGSRASVVPLDRSD